MIAHQLPNPGPVAGPAGQALRHALAKVVSEAQRKAASTAGGLVAAGTYTDLIATIDAASAAIDALQDV